jgi:hypothetical protein
MWPEKAAGTFKLDSKADYGNWSVGLNKTTYLTPRIVQTMHTRITLSVYDEIDHRDGNTSNNHPDNLRLATRSDNNRNTRISRNNKSGFKNVYWHKAAKSFCFQIRFQGKYQYIFSPSAETAYRLGCELREKLHKEFANHG